MQQTDQVEIPQSVTGGRDGFRPERPPARDGVRPLRKCRVPGVMLNFAGHKDAENAALFHCHSLDDEVRGLSPGSDQRDGMQAHRPGAARMRAQSARDEFDLVLCTKQGGRASIPTTPNVLPHG